MKAAKRFGSRSCPSVLGSFCLAALVGLLQPISFAALRADLGLVVDEDQTPIGGARLTLLTAQGSVVLETSTTTDGHFSVPSLAPGDYLLKLTAPNFHPRELRLTVPAEVAPIKIILIRELLSTKVTVTANRGAAMGVDEAAQLITVYEKPELDARPAPTVGHALEGNPGIAVQQTSYSQVSPFLRGLTGYQVLNLIDGIRFNNSIFRSGPNQYLAFVEPSQVDRVEVLLGPTSSQYGSDAMGGAIQLLTVDPRFSGDKKLDVNGEVQLFAASADVSGGANARISVGSGSTAWLLGATSRRHNDLRAGGGNDSRHVFKRLFGLSGDQVRAAYGSRQQDTGFTSHGWNTKLARRLSGDQSIGFWYQQTEVEQSRGHKDVWGGLGRLRSEFAPQGLRFFYGRYEKMRLGFLDSLTGTFSINDQSDGSVRQGLRASDRVVTDDVGVRVFGYSLQGLTHVGSRHALVFGAELYQEDIRSQRSETDPITHLSTTKRALYPNGSSYMTYGLFMQDMAELVRGKLVGTLGGRLTGIRFRAFADRNRDASGANLGVTDARQEYHDITFQSALVYHMRKSLSLSLVAGRGFRAPNLNDLGALGLNDLGYEIPAEEAIEAGGLVGESDGESSLSTGKRVKGLSAEHLYNVEFGVTLRKERLYARAQLFDAELKNPIARRTLLFPFDRIPTSLAGIPVEGLSPTTGQHSQGVVTVRTSIDSDPRAVKAFVNYGQARYYGLETTFRYSILPEWLVQANYSRLTGRELDPDRFVRRLPPQQGFMAVRYQPTGRKPWLELSTVMVGSQERLSAGDLTDERIGAARRRSDISDFFHGSLVRPFVDAGANGKFADSDDIFLPTGETLDQIRDRVLPIGATVNGVSILDDNSRVPLFTATPGFVFLGVRCGMQVSEGTWLNLALMNLLDRNYRTHGSGVDAPGINMFANVKVLF